VDAGDAISSMDERKFSWFHVKAILVSGIGFFTDAYDLFIINMVVPMIGFAYFGGKVPILEETLMKGASVVGTFIGQILFGVIADKIGRKKMYGVELIILIVGAIGCSMVGPPAKGLSLLAILGFWRFILGVGVGGDYPVSGVITSEFASVHNRGTMVALVFAMQGIGILMGAVVAVISVYGLHHAIDHDYKNLDYGWRILAGFGVAPALLAVYYRMTIPETPRFAMDVEGDISKGAAATEIFQTGKDISGLEDQVTVVTKKAGADSPTKAYFKRSFAYFSQWKNFKVLIGTSMCWFLLDIGYYGTNLNTSVVLGAIGYASAPTIYGTMRNKVVGSLIIALCGNVPGYYFTAFFVDKWGRKPIQIMGFVMLTICFTVLAAAYQQLKHHSLPMFVVIYSMAQFFFNFGPNSTTFIIPAEVFPTAVRSTGHGISAACGKAGAILAAQAFAKVADNPHHGMEHVLGIFAATCFGGLLFTFMVPETKGLSLEELSAEEQDQNSTALTARSKSFDKVDTTSVRAVQDC